LPSIGAGARKHDAIGKLEAEASSSNSAVSALRTASRPWIASKAMARPKVRATGAPSLDHEAVIGAGGEQVGAGRRESGTKRGAASLGSFECREGHTFDNALRFHGAGGGIQKLHQVGIAYIGDILARLFQRRVGFGERLNGLRVQRPTEDQHSGR